MTSAAAEKVYRSHGPDATIAVRLEVGAAGSLAWLPQETILFDRARLARESRLGPLGRLWYRAWWGARPMPAGLERALHRARWRGARDG